MATPPTSPKSEVYVPPFLRQGNKMQRNPAASRASDVISNAVRNATTGMQQKRSSRYGIDGRARAARQRATKTQRGRRVRRSVTPWGFTKNSTTRKTHDFAVTRQDSSSPATASKIMERQGRKMFPSRPPLYMNAKASSAADPGSTSHALHSKFPLNRPRVPQESPEAYLAKIAPKIFSWVTAFQRASRKASSATAPGSTSHALSLYSRLPLNRRPRVPIESPEASEAKIVPKTLSDECNTALPESASSNPFINTETIPNLNYDKHLFAGRSGIYSKAIQDEYLSILSKDSNGVPLKNMIDLTDFLILDNVKEKASFIDIALMNSIRDEDPEGIYNSITLLHSFYIDNLPESLEYTKQLLKKYTTTSEEQKTKTKKVTNFNEKRILFEESTIQITETILTTKLCTDITSIVNRLKTTSYKYSATKTFIKVLGELTRENDTQIQ